MKQRCHLLEVARSFVFRFMPSSIVIRFFTEHPPQEILLAEWSSSGVDDKMHAAMRVIQTEPTAGGTRGV